MGQTTITVDEEKLERFKSLKQDLDESQPDVPDHTNDSFLKCLMDTYEAVQEGHYGEPNDPLTLSEVDEIAEQLATELETLAFMGAISEQEAERLISSVGTIEERVNRIENTLENMGAKR